MDDANAPSLFEIVQILHRLDFAEREWGEDAVTFYDAGGPNGILSNTHPSELRNGGPWRSSEALYQASKHGSREAEEAIRGAPDALSAKSVSRRIQARLPRGAATSIPQVKAMLMISAMGTRHRQDRGFRDAIAATSGREIIELTPHDSPDRLWGTVRTVDGRLLGCNLVGQILMLLRDHPRNSRSPNDRSGD